MRRIHVAVLALAVGLLGSLPAGAVRNFQLKGKNELCGGIGFAANITDWAPGGFKWFNDYSRKLSRRTWLNIQFNIVAGGRGSGWCYDRHGRPYHCGYGWGGYAFEFAVGAKMKWRLQKIPLQFHAKFGGAFDILLFDDYYYNAPYYEDYTGVAFGFRGGFGVRYFFLPEFGVGAELMIPTIGPAIINHGIGAEVYAAIDFNVGVEWRF